MKQTIFLRAFVGLLLTGLLFAFTPPNTKGGDAYEVWAGKTQLFREYVQYHEKLNTVSLAGVPANESLVVYYSHCGQNGQNRSLSVRTASGAVLRTKSYRNESGRSGLMFSVQELLQLKKGTGDLQLIYASKELPSGKCVAVLH